VARGVSAAVWRYRTRGDRARSGGGDRRTATGWRRPVEAIDERTCAVDSGAESVEMLALRRGVLGADFELTGCPELA
jgi:hypothetical protein